MINQIFEDLNDMNDQNELEEKMTEREKIEQIIVNTLVKESEIEQDPPEETNDDEELPY